MDCTNCASTLTEGGRYCGRCGASATGDADRRGYAVQPGESVRSFNLVTSVMPLASGEAPQTYRWALLAGLSVPLVFGTLGYLPMAFAAAAALVPAVYVVYLYDVNEWEDQPWPVVLGTMVLSSLLAVVFTIVWHDHLLDTGAGALARGDGVDTQALVVLGLVVPVGVWLLAQLGPLWLASRPRFDDLIDGLTFGVASGAVFAAAETIVANWAVITQGPLRVEDPDAALWITLLFTAAVVKPVVYGSAIGIAGAGFSGLGPAYDGFTKGYARAAVEALVLLVAYGTGVYVCGLVDGSAGAVLGLLWALLVAGLGLMRLRSLLHDALLEAALEAAAVDEGTVVATSSDAYCPTCEMPLIPSASFCVACGTAVRAGSKRSRGPSRERVEVTVGAASGDEEA